MSQNPSNNSNITNTLFYSQRCITCTNLLTVMNNEDLIRYFRLICVDNILDKLPQAITAVPTMIVNGVNKPLVAQEAFQWISQVKFIKQQEQSNKLINPQQNQAQHRGPNAYDKEIMGGLSDSFAFTKTDEPLPHAYFGINEEKNHAIFTPPSEKNSLSRKDQTNLIKDLESRRSVQDNELTTIMKENQLNIYKQAEMQKLMMQNNNFGK